MKKLFFTILGLLCGLFGVAQILQMMGLIGTKQFHIAGVALTALGFALSLKCFQKVFNN